MNIYDEMIDYVMETVGECFDFCLNYLKIKPSIFIDSFLKSWFTKQIEKGSDRYCFGVTGVELAKYIINECKLETNNKVDKEYSYIGYRSKEYWVGYIATYYIWAEDKTYDYLFKLVPYNELVKLYPIYHENDERRIVDYVNKKKKNITHPLRTYREKLGLSQRDLSNISGISIRKIQSYEQHVKDINKCDAISLFKLASVLGVNMEDLLDK